MSVHIAKLVNGFLINSYKLEIFFEQKINNILQICKYVSTEKVVIINIVLRLEIIGYFDNRYPPYH